MFFCVVLIYNRHVAEIGAIFCCCFAFRNCRILCIIFGFVVYRIVQYILILRVNHTCEIVRGRCVPSCALMLSECVCVREIRCLFVWLCGCVSVLMCANIE